MEQKKPVRTFRDGGLAVSIWKNANEAGKIYYSLSPQKRYTKDEGATWESTNSYNRREGILLSSLMRQASEWISMNLEVEKKITQ